MSKTKPATATERVAKKLYLIILIPFVLFLIAWICIAAWKFGGENTTLKDTDAVAAVNGYEITALELSDRMSRDKAYAIGYFTDTYNAKTDGDFWHTEFYGQTPMEYLRERSLEYLKKYKVEQALAVKYSLIEKQATSYQQLLADMEKENADRSQKIASGQPVYGSKKYTKSSYFSYVYSNLQIDLRDKMGQKGEPLYVTDSALKEWYNSVKAERYAKKDTYKLMCYTVDLNENATDSERAAATDVMEKVRLALASGKDDDYIKKTFSDLKVRRLTINDDNAADIQKLSINFYTEVMELKKGEISQITEDNNTLYVTVCLSRKTAGYKSFSEHKNPIRKEYTEVKYEEYIDELTDKTKLDVYDNCKNVEF